MSSISDRILDSSPTVRDGALDVLCKYTLDSSQEDLVKFYPKLSLRIMVFLFNLGFKYKR